MPDQERRQNEACYCGVNHPHPEYDATNAIRLCDRCEPEYGVAAGADAGDRACSVCGSHDAPHVYPGPLARTADDTPSRGRNEA